MKIRNTFAIFIVSGFWHGANWTFIIWGLLNALYFLPLLLLNKNRINTGVVAGDRLLPSLKELLQMGLTFGLTVFAWIFFRAEDLNHAINYIKEIFSKSLFTIPDFIRVNEAKYTMFLILIFLIIEWIGRLEQYAIAQFGVRWHSFKRWGFYFFILLSILYFFGKEEQFIYFQF